MKAIRLRSRHWLVDERNRIVMGEGRRTILENIEKTGSINRTAKLMKMSYKGVWSKIKVSEDYLQMRLVDTDRKKGTSLTAEGKALLEKYITFKQWCEREEKMVFDRIFQDSFSTEAGDR
ncbi:MAG TPA: LysR family transcriptional regulator [Desulfobacteraceae bacterium]|jgi:molybdate transport system regulatory protein|nr:LysR family transcriptional regulator [Desulfobacteraceae bacterium]